MIARCSPALLAQHCRTLGLPFQALDRRVVIGCPVCFPFDQAQMVVLTPDVADLWTGCCFGCDWYAVWLLDLMKLQLAARRIEAVPS